MKSQNNRLHSLRGKDWICYFSIKNMPVFSSKNTISRYFHSCFFQSSHASHHDSHNSELHFHLFLAAKQAVTANKIDSYTYLSSSINFSDVQNMSEIWQIIPDYYKSFFYKLTISVWKLVLLERFHQAWKLGILYAFLIVF